MSNTTQQGGSITAEDPLAEACAEIAVAKLRAALESESKARAAAEAEVAAWREAGWGANEARKRAEARATAAEAEQEDARPRKERRREAAEATEPAEGAQDTRLLVATLALRDIASRFGDDDTEHVKRNGSDCTCVVCVARRALREIER